jgi:hypothetical protein
MRPAMKHLVVIMRQQTVTHCGGPAEGVVR